MIQGDLINLILRTVDRWWAGRLTERHGVVTSYDPKNYLAKVMFQPEGQESGWLPIETGHVGNGFGIAVGLTPGNGSDTGDQVIIRYQEGDIESGKIVQRVHNNEDKPPQVQSGEIVIWSQFKKSGADSDGPDGGQGGSGQQFYFKNDGSVNLTDGNGASLFFDGLGNATLKCNKLQITTKNNMQIDVGQTLTAIASQDLGIYGGNNVEVQAGQNVGLDGQVVIVQGGGSVSDGSVKPPSGQPIIPPFEVPA